MDLIKFNNVLSRVPNKSIVKICGLQTFEAAEFALQNGANFIGIICVPNRKRTINPEIAKQISNLIHNNQEYNKDRCLVGVFRNQSKEDVLKISNDYNIDIVQLHGDENWEEYQDFLKKPIIKRVIFPRDCEEVIKINQLAQSKSSNNISCIPLFDSEAGGTGELLDWESISNWAQQNSTNEIPINFILAGGLTPTNVNKAVNLNGVMGVDVSGGVETDNAKDFNKITNFINNAQL